MRIDAPERPEGKTPRRRALPALLLALLAVSRAAAERLPEAGRPEWRDEAPAVGPADPFDNAFALNPTGGPVRVEGMDKWGGGEYLARRNDPESRGLSLHHAVDFVGRAGQDVVAPIAGQLRRSGKGANTGADIVGRIGGARHKVKLLHFAVTVPDGPVAQGQVIGRVKDLGRVYPGMTSHVHMEVHEWRSHVGYRPKDPGIVVRPAPVATAQRE